MTTASLALPSGTRGSWRKRWMLVLLPILAVAVVIGGERMLQPKQPAQPVTVELPMPGFGPRTYDAALAFADARVRNGRAGVQYSAGEWLRQEALANALIARSRLSPTYDELAEATRVLKSAQRLAPYPSGPLLSEAALGIMTHRPGETRQALDTIARAAVAPPPEEQAEIEGLAGDVAFFDGDFAEAEQRYLGGLKLADSGSLRFRLGALAKARGRFDDAIAGLAASLRRAKSPTPFQVATIAAQVGAIELARGNAEAAHARFREADRLLSGFWLFQAHLAQDRAIAGDLAGAIRQLRPIAERTRNAEAMDALALWLRAASQPEESRLWAARAGEVWRTRLAQLPEAAYGHALEHELVFGTPARALSLARANLAARPYGESNLLLAQALIVNGDFAGALNQTRIAERKGWRSAPLFAVRAQALELLGEGRAAQAARDQALSLNPRIFSPETALIWFSHG